MLVLAIVLAEAILGVEDVRGQQRWAAFAICSVDLAVLWATPVGRQKMFLSMSSKHSLKQRCKTINLSKKLALPGAAID